MGYSERPSGECLLFGADGNFYGAELSHRTGRRGFFLRARSRRTRASGNVRRRSDGRPRGNRSHAVVDETYRLLLEVDAMNARMDIRSALPLRARRVNRDG